MSDDEGWRSLKSECLRLRVVPGQNCLDFSLVGREILLRPLNVDPGDNKQVIDGIFRKFVRRGDQGFMGFEELVLEF